MGASISVDQTNFATAVLEESYKQPVLVDFFAHWCGPCQMLKPVLEKLVREYDFVLAKVDIDENPELASTYGVEGVPDVKIVVDGTVSNGFVGVLPEPKLRELLARLNLRSRLESSLEAAFAQADAGHAAAAETLLNELLQQYPDHRGLLLEAANFHIECDRLDAAEALLSQIQESEKEYWNLAKSLKALIHFKREAAQAAGDSDRDRAYQEAAQWVVAKNYQPALDRLLQIVSQDRRYRDDGARKAMLAVFDLLGDDHPLTKSYRKQLVMALY